MTLLQTSLWIIICTLLLVASVKSSCSAARMLKNNGTASDALMFVFNMFAILVCMYGMYLGIERIAKYEEAPKVYTTEAPQVDTLQENGKTFYIYRFQDNHYPDFK